MKSTMQECLFNMSVLRRFATAFRRGNLLHIAVALSAAVSGAVSHAVAAPTIVLETVGPMSPRNQAAWWSPIGYRDGSLYLSYLAPNSPQDDVFVAKRTVDGVWDVRDTDVNAVYDVGHTQTSLALDGDGFLHVFYGMHNNPIRYVSSNQPDSITDGFTAFSSSVFGGFSGGSYTYPNLTTAPNGDVYMIIRDRRSTYSNANGRMYRFNNDSRDWSELPPFAGQNGTTVYPDHVIADASGDLHLLWEWAAGGAQGSRHYGSYARFDPDTNTYYRADGTSYSTNPITVAAADVYQGLEGSETFTNGIHGVQSAKMVLDEQNRPLIAYGYSLDGTDSTYEHRFARWTGTEWIHNTVTPGPFDVDKSWIAYSDGLLRYYGTLSPTDPMHTGTDDIFVRTSTDLGSTWSQPLAVTQGLNIQRPVGVTVGNVDYLYLPSISTSTLHLGIVDWDGGMPPPTIFPYFNDYDSNGLTNTDAPFELQAPIGQLNYAASGTTAVHTATQAVPDIGTEDFVLSSRFVLNSAAGTGNLLTTGLGAFGSASDFPSVDGNSFYLADWGVSNHASAGQLRILALGDSSDFTTVNGDTDGVAVNGSSIVLGETYELRLTGTYDASALHLTLALFDEAGNQIGISATATDATPLAGEFFGYRNRIAGANHVLDVSYDYLSLAALPVLPGDYNEDGVVNAADYVVWRDALHALATLPNEETAVTPHRVTPEDYAVWRSRFGNSTDSSSSNAIAVPEPTSLLLLVAGFLIVLLRGRQKSTFAQ